MPDVTLSVHQADMLRLIVGCLMSPTTGRTLYPSHQDAVLRQREAIEMLDRAIARAGHAAADPTATAAAP